MYVVAKLRQKQDMNVQQQGRNTNVTFCYNRRDDAERETGIF